MQKFYLKTLTALLVLFSTIGYGQDNSLQIIQDYLEKNHSKYGLVPQDYSDLQIYDQYYTKSMDLQQVYAIQLLNNFPVFKATGSFAIKNGEVVYFGNSFQSNIATRSNQLAPELSPLQAVSQAAGQLGLDVSGSLEIISTTGEREFLVSKAGISLSAIPVKLVYQPLKNESIRLAWDLSIQTLGGDHWWSVRVDALSGEIIDKGDWIVSCDFPAKKPNSATQKTAYHNTTGFGKTTESYFGDGSQYKVFALPVESPNHGARTVVSEPANDLASPYGWHDTNGSAGAEFNTTRGNNVWAFENRDGNQQPGPSPDGGSTLDFVFPLDFNQDPSGYIDPATVNLFYMNNMMHDIWYHYGFDEASGNFQVNNYSNGGDGNDAVSARAQDGSNGGPGNNATFGTGPDGTFGVMRMFTWQASGPPQYLTINTTGPLAGSYTGTTASFGPPVPSGTGITADFVLLEDDNAGVSTDTYDACDNITNTSAINGKIAVIRRGECTFVSKIQKAQDNGALAVIIVNNVATPPITMGGDSFLINIPSIMLSQSNGEPIITSLISGNTINGTILNTGPYQVDGDLDNGIIAHEYGHGISNRLTGGPSQADCLQNGEQMGEGWSDFFALMMTMESGDQPTDPRGIATYVLHQPITGSGLRQYPYTTNMSINPFTYADVQNQQFGGNISPHGVGSIWASMLWDLTWALIDEYGFDPDLYNGTGGNNIAMQLVIDGLKLQPCSPGFIDGRDAILAADMAANNGDNQCLIWTVFANRGLGWSASQGSSFSINDQTAAFDMPPNSVLNCTAGTSDFNNNFFKIYPNPTRGIVNIASTKINGGVQINLFDINGRKVLTKSVNFSGQTAFDITGLSAGIYILQLVSEGKTQTEKLIVQ